MKKYILLKNKISENMVIYFISNFNYAAMTGYLPANNIYQMHVQIF